MATGVLASLSDVKDVLNIPRASTTYDNPLTLALGIANQRILNYTGNSLFDKTAVVDIHRTVQQGVEFYLKTKPVSTVTSVQTRDLGEVLQDAEYDLLDPAIGEIMIITAAAGWPPSSTLSRNSAPWYRHNEKIWDLVQVTYSVTGWQPDQAEKYSAAQFAVYLYQRGSEGTRMSKRQGATSENLMGLDMPPWIESTFVKYKRDSVRVV